MTPSQDKWKLVIWNGSDVTSQGLHPRVHFETVHQDFKRLHYKDLTGIQRLAKVQKGSNRFGNATEDLQRLGKVWKGSESLERFGKAKTKLSSQTNFCKGKKRCEKV
jgi:hypothetical protein